MGQRSSEASWEMTLSCTANLRFSVTVYETGSEEVPTWAREGRYSLPRTELEFGTVGLEGS